MYQSGLSPKVQNELTRLCKNLKSKLGLAPDIRAKLGVGSERSGIYELISAWARKEVEFTSLTQFTSFSLAGGYEVFYRNLNLIYMSSHISG